MIQNQVMKAGDSIAAALAECYATIEGRRYNFAHAINLEAVVEKNKTQVPMLGRTGGGNKATGWSGSGSMTLHYNTSIMRELALKYKDEGIDTYFDTQVTNEDKTSRAGRQTTTLIDCNFDSVVVAKFDADGEYLDEDVDFTFEDFEIPEKFTLLPGMV